MFWFAKLRFFSRTSQPIIINKKASNAQQPQYQLTIFFKKYITKKMYLCKTQSKIATSYFKLLKNI